VIGYWLAPTILSGEYFKGAIRVLPVHDTVAPLVEHYEHPFALALHAVQTLPFWLAMAGVATAYIFVVWKPELANKTKKLLGPINHILENKYYFDHVYINYFSAGGVGLGNLFWKWVDTTLIDSWLVNGSAKVVSFLSSKMRRMQSGYLYHYVFVMVFGLVLFLAWLYWKALNGFV